MPFFAKAGICLNTNKPIRQYISQRIFHGMSVAFNN